MGYRANTVTVQREYGPTTFGNWEMFTSDFVPAMEKAGYEIAGNYNEDYFEIEKEKLQEFVDSIKTNTNQSIYPDYSNIDLYGVLQEAIDATKGEWVAWEWF